MASVPQAQHRYLCLPDAAEPDPREMKGITCSGHNAKILCAVCIHWGIQQGWVSPPGFKGLTHDGLFLTKVIGGHR